jgi:hypothetical protein
MKLLKPKATAAPFTIDEVKHSAHEEMQRTVLSADGLLRQPSQSRQQQTAGLVNSVDAICDKIATYLAPDLAVRPNYMSTAKSQLCHLLTARAIAARREATDIIWLYGLEGLGVFHSVLTDKDYNVIVGGQYGHPSHKFMGDAGFQVTPGGEILILLRKLTVLELCREYHKR